MGAYSYFMNPFHLTPKASRRLHHIVHQTQKVRDLRQAIALIAVHEGMSIDNAAHRVGVGWRTVYRWIEQERAHSEFGLSPIEPEAGGRPPVWHNEIELFLKALLSHSPDHLGYQAISWTVSLMKRHLSRWAGVEISGPTIRRHLHGMGYVWKRPRYTLLPDPDRIRKMREIRKKVTDLQERTVLLFEDETDLLLFPPLRSAWAERGMPNRVPISGWNEKRVVFGAINVASGHLLCVARDRERAQDFQFFLRTLQWHYRGWHLAIVLDSAPSHTARSTILTARAMDIELLFLPFRSPELNPMDTLWGKAKDAISANRQYEDIEDQADTFIAYLHDLSHRDALQKAGIASDRFWIRKNCQRF